MPRWSMTWIVVSIEAATATMAFLAWGGSQASGPPRPSRLGTPLKAPSICLKRPTNLIPTTVRYQTALGFIDVPGPAAGLQVAADPLLELRSEALNPAGQGGVIDHHAAVGQHLL